MSEPMRLTSVANPRVKAVVRLREGRGAGGRRKTGLFIAEGRREVGRAIEAGLTVREVYGCAELLERGGVLHGEPHGDPHGSRGSPWGLGATGGTALRFEVGEAVFRKMAYLREPEGVLAVVEQPRWTLEGIGGPGAGGVMQETLVLVAVGTEKPGNLGAMVRTAEAAGCRAVIATGAVDAFHPNAIRNSTGAVFSLPTVSAGDQEAVAWLQRSGVRIMAAAPAGAIAHTEADFTGPAAIVIGPEDTGLSRVWLDAADARVAIPMRGGLVDSLNASAAAAVLLFEALRQRGCQAASG